MYVAFGDEYQLADSIPVTTPARSSRPSVSRHTYGSSTCSLEFRRQPGVPFQLLREERNECCLLSRLDSSCLRPASSAKTIFWILRCQLELLRARSSGA